MSILQYFREYFDLATYNLCIFPGLSNPKPFFCFGNSRCPPVDGLAKRAGIGLAYHIQSNPNGFSTHKTVVSAIFTIWYPATNWAKFRMSIHTCYIWPQRFHHSYNLNLNSGLERYCVVLGNFGTTNIGSKLDVSHIEDTSYPSWR